MSWKKEQKEMPITTETLTEGASGPKVAQSDSKADALKGAKPSARPISGFSKLSKEEKISYIVENFITLPQDTSEELSKESSKETSKEKGDEQIKDKASQSNQAVIDRIISFWHSDKELQKTLDEFSENTLTNFMLPYGVAPNILINDKLYCVPMVIEESSVVAAASKAAKYWMTRGGFKAEVVKTTKVGQVHLDWKGEPQVLEAVFNKHKADLIGAVRPIMANMEKRGGGLKSLELRNLTEKEPGYYQLWAEFETCDAMGANFINSVLEGLGKELTMYMGKELNLFGEELTEQFEVVMAILSNFTPECLVKAWVECCLEELEDKSLGMSAEHFAKKFARSVRIAEVDVNRATTHNKGVMNGIDSVILATGNDFRAVEACAHTYAARSGQYKSLTHCEVVDGNFRFEIEIPLAIGTVGGLTSLHPLAKLSLDLLGRPSAPELMKIVAVIGLAQNFAALRSLVTTGIQKGHMKMHLMNILNHLETSEEEREQAKIYFEDKVISFSSVSEFIKELRNYQ